LEDRGPEVLTKDRIDSRRYPIVAARSDDSNENQKET
jgi:hypothetical protein